MEFTDRYHALIVGARGVGKSTLIRRVLTELSRPVVGFETVREPDGRVYIHECGKPRLLSEENLVGFCLNQHPESYREAFDRFAPRLQTPAPEGGITLMDEIGFMESCSEAFCKAVLSRLDGNPPVIAAVKDKDTPFLNLVREHKNCKCFHLTEENRDSLAQEVLAFLRQGR